MDIFLEWVLHYPCFLKCGSQKSSELLMTQGHLEKHLLLAVADAALSPGALSCGGSP